MTLIGGIAARIAIMAPCRFKLLASVDRKAREDCPSGRVRTGEADSLTLMTSSVEGESSTVMFLEILAAVQQCCLIIGCHSKNLVYLSASQGSSRSVH